LDRSLVESYERFTLTGRFLHQVQHVLHPPDVLAAQLGLVLI